MDAPEPDPIRKLRHDIRAQFNGLKLCSIALKCVESNEEYMELLAFIDQSADELTALLIKMDALLPDELA